MGDRWINVKSQEHSDFIQPEILHPLIVFIQSFFFFFFQSDISFKPESETFLLFLFRDLLELIEIVMN